MKRFLQGINYSILIPIALLLGLAPFYPQPHLLEKLRMLANGTLHRPIDIFDLFLHGAPALLLVLKVLVDLSDKRLKKG
ncbi:MAG: hypothetical protein P8X63_12315 [Desulfuromonadaceae bacterium]